MSIENSHQHQIPQTEGKTIPWASFYDTIVRLLSFGKDRMIRSKTIELAQIEPGDWVLDVGCGTGDLTIAAKAAAGPSGEVYGTDAATNMIAVAQEKASKVGLKVTFQVGLIENIEFQDGQFDVVLSSLMMHHLPDDLKQVGLAEINRVLKPGGQLLIVDMQSTAGGSVKQQLSDLMIQLHGGHTAMQDNVTRQIPFVETAGFVNVHSDKINRQFSYITAQKANLG